MKNPLQTQSKYLVTPWNTLQAQGCFSSGLRITLGATPNHNMADKNPKHCTALPRRVLTTRVLQFIFLFTSELLST
jgi:hypothetical protein